MCDPSAGRFLGSEKMDPELVMDMMKGMDSPGLSFGGTWFDIGSIPVPRVNHGRPRGKRLTVACSRR